MLKDQHLLSTYGMPGTFPSLPHPLIHHTVVPILQLKSYDILEICVSYARTVPFQNHGQGPGCNTNPSCLLRMRRKCLPESCPSYPAPNCPDEAVLTEVWPNGLSVLESASLNYWTRVLQLLKPACPRACPLQEREATAMRRPHTATRVAPVCHN